MTESMTILLAGSNEYDIALLDLNENMTKTSLCFEGKSSGGSKIEAQVKYWMYHWRTQNFQKSHKIEKEMGPYAMKE